MYGKKMHSKMSYGSQKMAPMKGLHSGMASTGDDFAAGFTGRSNPNKVRRSSGMDTGKKDLMGLDNPTGLSSITEDCCEMAFAGATSAAYRSMMG